MFCWWNKWSEFLLFSLLSNSIFHSQSSHIKKKAFLSFKFIHSEISVQFGWKWFERKKTFHKLRNVNKFTKSNNNKWWQHLIWLIDWSIDTYNILCFDNQWIFDFCFANKLKPTKTNKQTNSTINQVSSIKLKKNSNFLESSKNANHDHHD